MNTRILSRTLVLSWLCGLVLPTFVTAQADPVTVTEWDQFAETGITAAGPAMDHVLDVESRVVLASKAVRSLSMQLAKQALDEGVAVLRSLGLHGGVLVQSDGGSDFTGEVFQTACLRHGSWVRCKVSQKGGMAVLERLNRTYKYSYAFRHDWNSLAEVQTALPDFHRCYSTSPSRGYKMPRRLFGGRRGRGHDGGERMT